MNTTPHPLLIAFTLILFVTSCASSVQKTYYPDGTLKSVRSPNFHETYHENGKVKERISLNNAGQRHGDTIEYLSDGRAWSSRPYSGGEADGTEYRLFPQRTPVCTWRDGIVRSIYNEGQWETRELTPSEVASIERKEAAERLQMELAMREADREEDRRQQNMAALAGLASALQNLNAPASPYPDSGDFGSSSGSQLTQRQTGSAADSRSSSSRSQQTWLHSTKQKPFVPFEASENKPPVTSPSRTTQSGSSGSKPSSGKCVNGGPKYGGCNGYPCKCVTINR